MQRCQQDVIDEDAFFFTMMLSMCHCMTPMRCTSHCERHHMRSLIALFDASQSEQTQGLQRSRRKHRRCCACAMTLQGITSKNFFASMRKIDCEGTVCGDAQADLRKLRDDNDARRAGSCIVAKVLPASFDARCVHRTASRAEGRQCESSSAAAAYSSGPSKPSNCVASSICNTNIQPSP